MSDPFSPLFVRLAGKCVCLAWLVLVCCLLGVDKEGKRKLGKRAISTKLWPTPTFVAVLLRSTIPTAIASLFSETL